MIPVIIGVLKKIRQNFVRGLEELEIRFEDRTTLLFISARILRRVQKISISNRNKHSRDENQELSTRETYSGTVFFYTNDTTYSYTQKVRGIYTFTKSQGKVNHLMYIEYVKIFTKAEKKLEVLIQAIRIYSQGIEMEFGIEKCVMLIMKNGKYGTLKGIELLNQEDIKTLGQK